ncbi:helix-turn-helix transcriptional regulator [uncultured Fusobacterium sp.]|uniref:helix-turn-helix domain-containing protein n=1 Tax=uncultured Fusobacterium sp. TaxID=159267 RepID=UPI0028064AAC|nr:helix-turn-helix transcriptional regulator [uncultured Fusobacterium sp.]
MEKLSIVLKKLRESRNITIIKLAELSGVGNGTIGDIERGKSNGSKKSLEKISNALKLTAKEKDELYSAYLGRNVDSSLDNRVLQLSKKDLSKYEKVINEASLFFNDEDSSDEDKQKVMMAINEMFFRSKEINKEKYAHKSNKEDQKK